MKRFFSLMTVLLTMVCHGQTSKQLFLKSSDNKLFNYGRTATRTTTDSALTTLDLITINDDEAGLVEVQVVGLNDSTTTAVTGSYIARYVKKAGTLTLGTPTAISATVTDATLGTSTWSLTTSSNNIIVQVKGKLGFTVNWICNVRRLYRKSS